MRPWQNVEGLPEDVAGWLCRWRRRTTSAVGRCYAAMREAPLGVTAHRGLLTWTDDKRQIRGMLHTWGVMDGRVVDPTVQQAGPYPVRLLCMVDVCASCGLVHYPWMVRRWDSFCRCWWGGALLEPGFTGEEWAEEGAPTAAQVWAAWERTVAARAAR